MLSRTTIDEMRLAGMIPAAGGLLLVVGAWVAPNAGTGTCAVVATAMALAGLLIARWPVAARFLASAALALWVAATAADLARAPAAALASWLAAAWLLTALWIVPGLPIAQRVVSPRAIAAAKLARVRIGLRFIAPLAVAAALAAENVVAAARAGLAIAVLAAVVWTLLAGPQRTIPRRWLLVIASLAPLGAVVICGDQHVSDLANVVLLVVALIASAFIRLHGSRDTVVPRWWEHLLENPARQLVTTFLLLILLGTLLLKMPRAATDLQPIAFVDAAFTAVSAVCVTGLIVLDTPIRWSGWGQAVILVLIQLGGLGIMSFATAFLSAIGHRLPLRQEGAFAQLASGENRRGLYSAVKTVLVVTFAAELFGALVLLPRFLEAGVSVELAVWRSVFTAVSAFCNAGFALQSDSLVGYARDPVVLHAVGTLIVLGGLSPAVVVGLVRRRRPDVQTRLVLVATGGLLVIGASLFAAAEWTNVLAGFGVLDKLHNAWFQSVTLRTAGFNSVDIEALRPATVTLCVLWMFIGGSPGGTAGGIKTTTFAVLVLAVAATVQGRRTVTTLGRAIAHPTVYRAASVATIGSLSLVLFVLAIQLTQVTDVVPGIFEVVSALGTVGLSMGATATLDTVGKIIIMVAMFVGRVGSLTLIMFLIAQQAVIPWRVPEESVAVG